MALALELKRRLEDAEMPLSKRIRMAEDIFKSNQFPLTSHRSITMNWLCNLANDDSDDLCLIDSIKKCFECNFVYSDIDNDLIEKLIKLFRNKLDSPTIVMIDTLICIISNTALQKYFYSNLSIFNDIIMFLLRSISFIKSDEASENNNALKELVHKILILLVDYNKSFIEKNEFYNNVTKNTIVEFIVLLDVFQDQALNNFCENTIQECVFVKDSIQAIEQYMEILENFESKKCLHLGLTIFTAAFVKAYKETTYIFQLFKKLSKCTNDYNVLFHQCIIIDIIKIENASLDIEHNGETFMAYLQKYAMKLLTKCKPHEILFKFLKSIILLNPLIIEPNLITFLIKSMMMEKPNELCLKEFTQLLKLVIEALLKLNRIHKLPSLLLYDLDKAIQISCLFIENVNNENCEKINILDIENIWPSEVAEFWGKSMESLNASITWGTLQSLLYNLENCGVLNVKDESNILGARISTQIILRFISHFLNNCKLPLMSKENYFKLSDYSRKTFELLTKVSQIIVKKKLKNLLPHWLHTTYIVGEFTIMLKYYWCCMDNQLELQMIEQYFSEKQWQKLCKYIDECDCGISNQLLIDIVLQNVRYQNICSSTNQITFDYTPYSQIILRDWKILLNSKAVFKTLLPLMPQLEILLLLEHSIYEIIEPNNLHILKLDYLQENIKFISSIMYCIFYEIAKCFSTSKNNKLFTDKLYQNFKDMDLMENKQEFIKTIIESLNEEVVVEKIKHLETIRMLINALQVLNLQYMSSLDKSCTSIFIFSVLGNFNEIAKSITLNCERQQNIQGCQSICELILSDILETGTIFDIDQYISSEIYLRLCSWIIKSAILQQILESAIKKQENSNIVVKLTKVMKEVNKKAILVMENCDQIVLRELLTIPTVCLTVMSKINKKWHNECRSLILELRSKCFDVVNGIICKIYKEANPECLSVMLPSYNILLQSYINNKNENVLNAFPTFLKYSMEHILHSTDAQFFIVLVARSHKHFKANLPCNFLMDVWDIYYKMNCTVQNIHSTENVMVLLENCDDKQFEDIILKLNKNTIMLSRNTEEFPTSLNLWVNITEAVLSGSKSKIRLEALTKLSQDLLAVLVEHTLNEVVILVIYKFFLTVINNPMLQINLIVIESILSAVLLASFNNLNSICIELFKVCSEIIYFSLLKRTSLLLDRLPIVIQGSRHLVKALSYWSSLKESNKSYLDKDEFVLGDLGHSIEKVFNALVKLKRNLSRPAYLMHDIIVELTSHTLTNEIKQSLLNCCYQLHSLCDSHALKYLNTVSSAANREIFKDIHNTYNKFYMFKGKI